MEAVVFKDSPLADYLEGTGEHEADWGIEPTLADPAQSVSATFAPPAATFSARSRFHTRKLRPLKLQNPDASRRWRFYRLLKLAVTTRLSTRENAKFLERFRYIIVASQLLNEHINVSHYQQSMPHTLEPLEDSAEILSAANISKQGSKRHLASGGACVLVVAILFAWVVKTERVVISKGKSTVGLLLVVVVVVYLFAHARREYLRKLRSRVIHELSKFVEKSQAFDIAASNAVTLIQEVELISRGYSLSAPLPPISRLEKSSQVKRCSRIRQTILSALGMALPSHSRSCATLRPLIKDDDLERFFDIYEVSQADLEEAALELDEDEFVDMESLKALKTLLHRLHTTRRLVLCCLLALDADGGRSDFAKWKGASDQLRSVGSLMGELGDEIYRVLADEERFDLPATPIAAFSPGHERWRGQLRKLGSLSQALRGLQTKMHLLREESNRTLLDGTSDVSKFGDDLLAHYDSIGNDLRSLVDEWEKGRRQLALATEKQHEHTFSSQSSPTSNTCRYSIISGTTLAESASPSRSIDDNNGWDVTGQGLFSSQASKRLSSISVPETARDIEVYEATAEPRQQSGQRTKMTREERIKKVQEDRRAAAEKLSESSSNAALMLELNGVLGNRPQRRSKHLNYSPTMGTATRPPSISLS